jgi:hypothetical protein
MEQDTVALPVTIQVGPGALAVIGDLAYDNRWANGCARNNIEMLIAQALAEMVASRADNVDSYDLLQEGGLSVDLPQEAVDELLEKADAARPTQKYEVRLSFVPLYVQVEATSLATAEEQARTLFDDGDTDSVEVATATASQVDA